MQLRSVQFSPFSGYSLLLRSEYLPQHPILKHLGFCSPRNMRDQVSHPYKTADIFIVLFILIFICAPSCSTYGVEERCIQSFGGEI